jgi:hypothetical protein
MRAASERESGEERDRQRKREGERGRWSKEPLYSPKNPSFLMTEEKVSMMPL